MPTPNAPDNFEKWTSGTKNLLQIILFVVVLVALFSTSAQKWLGRELAFLAGSGVESVKIGELEFKLKQAQDAVRTIANNPPATPSSQLRPAPQDKPPTPAVAPALEVLNEPGTFWVYVGQFQNGHFLSSPNFIPDNPSRPIPSPGDILTATTDTYKRSAAPVKQGNDWKLGDIIGVVRKGQTVKVRSQQTVEGGNIWVQAVPAETADSQGH